MIVLEGIQKYRYLILLIGGGFIGILCVLRYQIRKRREKMPVRVGNDQTIGTMEHQNDYFSTVWKKNEVCAILADGIGDRKIGGIASTSVVQTVTSQFNDMNQYEEVNTFLDRVLRLAHRQLTDKLGNGGASAAIFFIQNGYVSFASVGNVHLYLYHNNELYQLNKPQTYKQLLEKKVLSTKIPREVALKSRWKQEVTNFLGFENFQEIEISKKNIYLDQRAQLFMCSAGVYRHLSIMEMENILAQRINPQEKAEKMLKTINNKQLKTQDNGTIVILEKW
jgi:PPM family protein phosphatase